MGRDLPNRFGNGFWRSEAATAMPRSSNSNLHATSVVRYVCGGMAVGVCESYTITYVVGKDSVLPTLLPTVSVSLGDILDNDRLSLFVLRQCPAPSSPP